MIRTPREKAARALCEIQGLSPDELHEGKPMWLEFIDQVDAVLHAALGETEWAALVRLDAKARF